MLEILYEIAEHGESEAARVSAADKILDRALGKSAAAHRRLGDQTYFRAFSA
jgi:hypothetical protein